METFYFGNKVVYLMFIVRIEVFPERDGNEVLDPPLLREDPKCPNEGLP